MNAIQNDRRVPADILADANAFRKLKALAAQNMSVTLEIKTERLYGVDPKPGEEVRIAYNADATHQKEVFGRTLDEAVKVLEPA